MARLVRRAGVMRLPLTLHLRRIASLAMAMPIVACGSGATAGSDTLFDGALRIAEGSASDAPAAAADAASATPAPGADAQGLDARADAGEDVVSPDAAASSDADATLVQDEGADIGTEAAVDGSASCPLQQPSIGGMGSVCSGSPTCTYGHATCCGIGSSAFTCRCQAGTFVCIMTVECNFICPDAGSD